jgi:dienelactone hydrolase
VRANARRNAMGQKGLGMHVSRAIVCALISMAVGTVPSQQWPLLVPEPPAAASLVTRHVRFATTDGTHLLMDVYRPAQATAALPAVIFYTLYWPAEGPSARASSDWYRAWARLAAANGLVAIVPDLRAEPGTGNAEKPARPLGDDFRRLLAHLTTRGATYGVDPDRLAVFAESGATWAALPAVQDPAQTAIKAAVMYYGSANVETFRRDVPVLWVRAGLDSARTNADIARLAAIALSQNAPVTLIDHPNGRHGFEGRDDSPLTREIVEQTLAFLKRATAPDNQASPRKAPAELATDR